MNEQSSKTKVTEVSLDEMNLLWDEYKYRHELIWKHLIRSTIAVAILISLPYTTQFKAHQLIFILGGLLATTYTTFNFFLLRSEVQLLQIIKKLYWELQDNRFPNRNLRREDKLNEFRKYVEYYSIGLIIMSLLITIILITGVHLESYA